MIEPAHGLEAHLGRRGPSPATACGAHDTAVTRRGFLKTGALVAAAPLLADVPFASAQSPARNVTKVHDIQTSADVAKAEQEGEVVYYGHDSEQGIAILLGLGDVGRGLDVVQERKSTRLNSSHVA